eukprot:SAG22_NODE_23_length_31399_cov_35.631313_25_plen_52_part_00
MYCNDMVYRPTIGRFRGLALFWNLLTDQKFLVMCAKIYITSEVSAARSCRC